MFTKIVKLLNSLIFQRINQSKNKTIIYLILIVCLAAGVRTIRALEQTRYDGDAYLYFYLAKNISLYNIDYAYIKDNPFNPIPPLLPFIESCGFYVGLSPEMAGLLLGGILGSLMPIAVFIIILNITNGNGYRDNNSMSCIAEIQNSKSKINKHFLALFGAFLIAVHPYLIRISVSCMRECLYIPLLFFSIMFAVIAIKKRSILIWGLVGVLGALMAMTRREGVEILTIFLLWIFLDILREVFSKNKMFKSKNKYFIYLSKITILFYLVFWIIILPVENKLKDTNCKWNITSTLENGLRLVK